MNRDELRQAVLDSLATVAPELDPSTVRPDEPLREQLDIDSFDFLQSIIALDRKLSVSIPESDYGRLTTLDACVDYLAARLAAREQGAGAPA
ncbi:MAG: acyl carrier protein [Archangium sp.]